MNGKQAQPAVADDPTEAVRAAPHPAEPRSPKALRACTSAPLLLKAGTSGAIGALA